MIHGSQDYPLKAVRVIEPFGAGGGPDVMARAVSRKLSKLWGQPVAVENHPGAGEHEGARVGRHQELRSQNAGGREDLPPGIRRLRFD